MTGEGGNLDPAPTLLLALALALHDLLVCVGFSPMFFHYLEPEKALNPVAPPDPCQDASGA